MKTAAKSHATHTQHAHMLMKTANNNVTRTRSTRNATQRGAFALADDVIASEWQSCNLTFRLAFVFIFSASNCCDCFYFKLRSSELITTTAHLRLHTRTHVWPAAILLHIHM